MFRVVVIWVIWVFVRPYGCVRLCEAVWGCVMQVYNEYTGVYVSSTNVGLPSPSSSSPSPSPCLQVREKVTKVLCADKLIHEQVLQLHWRGPDEAGEKGEYYLIGCLRGVNRLFRGVNRLFIGIDPVSNLVRRGVV